jgi:hypothetical protein
MKKKKIAPKARINFFHYVKLFFVCQILLLIGFIGTNYFLNPRVGCANSNTCLTDISEKAENYSTGIFHGREVVPPKIELAADTSSVLGTTTPNENKHIYVDLSTQKLHAYEDKIEFMQAYVSTGRWGRTPVGNWNIWIKLRSTRMSGGSGNDYYNLPNVPYTMFFFGDFGIHGAYWHNNFGHTMSHGCVNMRIVDAKKLFEWADGPSGSEKGTAVSVCNKFTAPDICIQE